MSTPDLPMRERIAEAICEHDGWYGVPGKGAYCDCEHFLAPDGAYAVNAWEAHRADAVLTVLADLPDTAVEAGAKAAREHQIVTGYGDNEPDAAAYILPYTFCPACYWEPQNGSPVGIELQAENHRTRAVLTATIAAIKEGL